MRHRLQTTAGQALYKLRRQTVEPVFGILKSVLGFRQFRLRGRAKAALEWTLVCLACNLKRLHRLGAGLKTGGCGLKKGGSARVPADFTARLPSGRRSASTPPRTIASIAASLPGMTAPHAERRNLTPEASVATPSPEREGWG